MEKIILIKDLQIEDKPREKLLSFGVNTLTISELLAILIGTGTANKSAIDLSQELIASANGSINELARKNIKELTKINGIGIAKALSLNAAFELGKRRKLELSESYSLKTSKNVYDAVQPLIADARTEEFWVLALNKANKIISKQQMSKGGVAATIVDVKCIIKFCVEHLASSAIVFHNHPSGNKMPSQADKKITEKIKLALSYCDITLLDHLIICNQSYYSFSDEGLL